MATVPLVDAPSSRRADNSYDVDAGREARRARRQRPAHESRSSCDWHVLLVREGHVRQNDRALFSFVERMNVDANPPTDPTTPREDALSR